MGRTTVADTRTRLLDAAAACFAARGFHGTTIREIAERAGVNVAAGHYHVGSKKDLYLEVLRAQFAHVRTTLAEHGATVRPDEIAGLSRPALHALLRRRARAMLTLLLGPPPSLHGTLMQREMCDSSEALPIIVEEFIRPFMNEITAVVRRLAPRLDDAAVERCGCSIVGQALFYRFAMPAVLSMWGRTAYDPALAATLGAHIAEFSLGGLERLGRARPAAGAPERRRRGR